MASQKYECDKCGRTFKTEEACEVHEEHCKGKESHNQQIIIKEKSNGSGVAFLFLILIVLVIWGFVGGAVAQDVGVTCDMGIGENFCWIWHTNPLGQVAEGINDFFGNG